MSGRHAYKRDKRSEELVNHSLKVTIMHCKQLHVDLLTAKAHVCKHLQLLRGASVCAGWLLPCRLLRLPLLLQRSLVLLPMSLPSLLGDLALFFPCPLRLFSDLLCLLVRLLASLLGRPGLFLCKLLVFTGLALLCCRSLTLHGVIFASLCIITARI